VNLVDIVRRRDRALTAVSPGVEPGVRVCAGQKMQTVEVPAGCSLRLSRILEFRGLQSFPSDLDWKWTALGKRSQLEIALAQEESGLRHVLFAEERSHDDVWHDVQLRWPPAAGTLPSVDMIISCSTGGEKGGKGGAAALGISPAFNARSLVPTLLKGVGAEVGPGLNPHIRPQADVDVTYVEVASADDWVTLYRKRDKPPPELAADLWQRYVVSRAETLEAIADETLDFVFSNHVFEHLMNPLGVLENWSRKLKATGIVYNVMPDAGCCFDLRQPLSEPSEWLVEYECGQWQPPLGKYERWCRYTAPYNTPDDLISRRYSIHMHYYAPATAARLAALAIDRGWFDGHFIAGARNHKDFALVLFKGSRSK
jgi:SAM-dependent methyltransferase